MTRLVSTKNSEPLNHELPTESPVGVVNSLLGQEICVSGVPSSNSFVPMNICCGFEYQDRRLFRTNLTIPLPLVVQNQFTLFQILAPPGNPRFVSSLAETCTQRFESTIYEP